MKITPFFMSCFGIKKPHQTDAAFYYSNSSYSFFGSTTAGCSLPEEAGTPCAGIVLPDAGGV